MNRDIKGGLLTLLLLLLLAACEKEESLGPDGPEEGFRYLTGVIAERLQEGALAGYQCISLIG